MVNHLLLGSSVNILYIFILSNIVFGSTMFLNVSDVIANLFFGTNIISLSCNIVFSTLLFFRLILYLITLVSIVPSCLSLKCFIPVLLAFEVKHPAANNASEGGTFGLRVWIPGLSTSPITLTNIVEGVKFERDIVWSSSLLILVDFSITSLSQSYI